MTVLKWNSSDNIISLSLGKEITYLVEQGGKLMASESRPEAAQAALFWTSRGWVLLDYTGYITWVNGVRVADCKGVSEGDRIQIGGIVATLSEEIRREIISATSGLTHEAICYVCSTGFVNGDEVVYCPTCGTPHHADCWLFNNEGCAAGAHCDYRKPRSIGINGERNYQAQPQNRPPVAAGQGLELTTVEDEKGHLPQSTRASSKVDKIEIEILEEEDLEHDEMLVVWREMLEHERQAVSSLNPMWQMLTAE